VGDEMVYTTAGSGGGPAKCRSNVSSWTPRRSRPLCLKRLKRFACVTAKEKVYVLAWWVEGLGAGGAV
jgi:hypothetical protein